jgi:hypothetical protein
MGARQYAEGMGINLLTETEDEKHRRLLDALRTRLVALQSADAAGTPPPPLAPEEEADEATREILNDQEMIIGIIEGIEDVMDGHVVTLEEYRAERRRSSEGDDAAAG